ncbi:MAG: hypothetical protein J6Y20_08785 [Lachnospiraceae bacterium]|nr:hypothetical protein [Lachnospiraceae bacterium]
MYESPIKVDFTEPVIEAAKNEADEYIVRAVQQMDVTVDRDELMKALQYDRDQYLKGYTDAVQELQAELEDLRAYRRMITMLPDCNTCLKNYRCKFRPKPGQATRINCFDHLGYKGS